jgi:hypothetical protein
MSRIYGIFDGERKRETLPELCLELLSEQRKIWPACYQGYKSLEHNKVREITCNGFSVRVQHNPGRIKSTLADVEEKEVMERPCFLCADNLPEEQKGILYRNEYLILCNPMPVFSSHFTVCHKEHRPQSIAEHVGTFIQLMIDLGSDWTVLYNGPRCGASAPDHLHFQAVPSRQMPVEAEIKETERLEKITEIDGILFSTVRNIGREVIAFEGENPAFLANACRMILSALKRALFDDIEPMINIAGFHIGKRLLLMVFPRVKHRPDAFFREGDARLMVSPAVVEMGGVIVTPAEKDFKRLEASAIEDIFREVSLDGKTVSKAIDQIAASNRINS